MTTPNMPTITATLTATREQLDYLIAENSPTDGSPSALRWHRLAVLVRELGHHLADLRETVTPAGVVPQTVGTEPVRLGLGEMIRYSSAASRLQIGAIIYNTNDVRNISGDENRHYFLHVKTGIWQPCNSGGVVRILPDFPDGFTSGQLFMPVHVYGIV